MPFPFPPVEGAHLIAKDDSIHGESAGSAGSKGWPFTRLVIGQDTAGPVFSLYRVWLRTRAGRRPACGSKTNQPIAPRSGTGDRFGIIAARPRSVLQSGDSCRSPRRHPGEEIVESGPDRRGLDGKPRSAYAELDGIAFLYPDPLRDGEGYPQGEAVTPLLDLGLHVSTMRLQRGGVKGEVQW